MRKFLLLLASVLLAGNTTLYSWSPVEHLVVIIGQTGDGNSYIYIDPDNGGYKTINYYSILGPNFSVRSLKKY